MSITEAEETIVVIADEDGDEYEFTGPDAQERLEEWAIDDTPLYDQVSERTRITP